MSDCFFEVSKVYFHKPSGCFYVESWVLDLNSLQESSQCRSWFNRLGTTVCECGTGDHRELI